METLLISPNCTRALCDGKVETRQKAAAELSQLTQKNFQQSGLHDGLSQYSKYVETIRNRFLLNSQSASRRGGLVALKAIVTAIPFPTPTYAAAADLESGQKMACVVLDNATDFFGDNDIVVRFAAIEVAHETIKRFHMSVVVERLTSVFKALLAVVGDSDRRISSVALELSNCFKQVCSDANTRAIQTGVLPPFPEDAFVGFLTHALESTSPTVVSWLLSWVRHVHTMPQCNVFAQLPRFLPALYRLLAFPDCSREVQTMLDMCWSDIHHNFESSDVFKGIICDLMLLSIDYANSDNIVTRRSALTWVYRLLDLGRLQMFPLAHAVVYVVLEQVGVKDDDARTMATRVNDLFHSLVRETGPSADDQVQGINYSDLLDRVIGRLKEGEESTRLASLKWIVLIHNVHQHIGGRESIVSDALFIDIVSTLHTASPEVLRASVFSLTEVAGEARFGHFISALLLEISTHASTMLVKVPTIALQLQLLCQGESCQFPERLFLKVADILPQHNDKRFVCKVVIALHTMLLTLKEMLPLRTLLRRGLSDTRAKSAFVGLFHCWVYDPVAAVGLCLLSSAYDQALCLVEDIGSSEVTAHTLVQLDRLAQLIESPVFSFLRTALLKPRRNASLLRTLFGIQMILPQSSQPCQALHYRLQSAPTIAHLPGAEDDQLPKSVEVEWWHPLFSHYVAVQQETLAYELVRQR